MRIDSHIGGIRIKFASFALYFCFLFKLLKLYQNHQSHSRKQYYQKVNIRGKQSFFNYKIVKEAVQQRSKNNAYGQKMMAIMRKKGPGQEKTHYAGTGGMQ